MSNTRLDELTPEKRRLLALRLKARQAAETQAPSIEEGAGGEYPLAFTQQRLWMLDRLQPGGSAYNMPTAARFKQPLDPAVVERAIGEIVRRHGVLRTRFETRDGEPVQVVKPFSAFHLPVQDLSALPRDAAEAELDRIAMDEATAPFALDQAAFRARLVRMGPADVAVLATMHHIVSDGWSISVFWREFQELLAAFRAGLASPLPPLRVQFGEHARRERERLSGAALDGLLAWWRQELAGAPTLLELPTDHPRPAVATQRGASYLAELDGILAERAGALALREGTTPFNVLLAAFQVVMGRYAGTGDLLVGTASAGRRTRDVEPLIGFLAGTLVLRGDLSGAPTFRQLLARVHAATMGAFEHEDLPFERLVEEMAPERTLAYSPLVQALFVQQTSHPDQGRGGEETDDGTEGVRQELNAAKFDLTFAVAQEGGRTWAGVEYAADLFDAPTIERMVRHYATLLNAALSTPDAPIASLEMMPAEEAQAVRALSTGAAMPVPDATLHALIAAQAARTPDAVALAFEGRTMTYAELDARANQLAHRLRRLGVGPEVRAGVCMERGFELVVSLLAVLKAGGAYVPLDPEYPAERLAYILADAAVPVLLTQPQLADALPEHGARTLVIDPDFGVVRDEPAEAPRDVASPDHLAYAIYTSGSTGNPKGAMNAHRGVVNRLAWMQAEYGLSADDVVLQKTPFSFDVSVWEFFWPLMAGARLVLARPGGHRDAAYLARLIDGERVTTLHFVPSMLAAFLDAAPAGTCGSLARVVCSGEALPAELATRFYAWMDAGGNGRVGLHNLYGPTEAAVDVTYWPCARGDASGGVPIGLPVANTQIHVLDDRGAPVPVGIAGELHIAGVQVGRGYLGRPALTAEKFVPDPFSAEPGARMYRTGDRVRRRADGALLFLGRIDFQVKLRGFRIELGEIESQLLRHPALSAAVAVVREDGAGGPRLVAYVVPREGSVVPGAEELRAHLRGTLPEHMLPSAFVAMDALPLTGSGKTDRRALPAPGASDAGAEHVAPRTQTEQVLAAIWAELLGAERVGVGDGFFELGGHSLLATRAVARVREALGVEVPVRAVFEHPALGAFAGEVDRLLRASAGVEAPPIRPGGRTGDLPLSFAQERLWFVDRLEPGSPVYHMPFHYLLRGALDVDALRRAFGEIVRRHETLRTALPFTGEQPVQRILPAAPVELPVHDVSAIAGEAERDAATEAVMQEVAERAFDLERGPLFRAALVRVADDEHVLTVNLHHVVSDGWSVGVLWNELSALYAAFARGEASPLAEPALQYGDFAVWQRGWLAGDVLEAQLGYWRRKLAGAPPLLELPTDRPRPAVQTYGGAVETAVLGGEDAKAVLALGRREGSTLFMVLLAAMDVVFGRLAGQDDVVIGTPIAGRTRAETEGMIGLFLNSLALRTDLSGDPTFRELLRRVRESTLEAYAHQDLPFERILEELAPERSLSHSPLFQVMLNLSNFAEGDVSLPGLELQPVGGSAAPASKFDLTLYAGEAPEGIVLHLVYNPALFDAARVRSMLAQLSSVLRQASENAEQPIHRLSLLTDDALPILPDPTAALSTEWRGSVPEIFAAHAARTPHALAVEDPQERWTYADLDADTTRLAHRLIADGVRSGDVVAILGHRSAALVRALLGTMKAGAAFLILDPAYPPARLAEYVRIARPTGFLPLAAAGDVPEEVVDALSETVVSTLPLDIRRVALVDKTANSADSHQPPPAVLGEVASLSEPEGAPARGLKSSEADLAPPVEIGPDSLAYLSFTSGTTGRPKAVMGRHGSLTHFTPWLAERFELGASDRFSLLSGLAHDPLHRDVFTPLQLGASVIAPIADKVAEPGYLARWMRDAEITVAHLTPAMGQLLTDVGAPTAGGSGLSDAPRNQPATQPPPAVLGEVGEWSEPGGGARAGLSEAARSQPGTQPPPAVLGEVGEWSEPGGGARAGLSEAARSRPATQPPPAVLGEVASLGEPVGAPAAGTASSEARRAEGPTVDSLRRAFFVGDVLTRTDVARMHRLAPNLTVINYYGSTETQRAVAHFVVPRNLDELTKDIIPVGTGIPDVQVLIRNAAGERVGIGEVGEMWMRSPHVALGYLGDPELTAARFVPNPWTGDAADPAYRTGDLGRYRPDGVAEIAGRADQQVKIRGFRIEPGEIEAALRAHSAIRDTVVVARGDADARRLVAYVVAEGGDAPASDALREWLRGSVPDYMVPSAWVFLPALPVTPNGKVDRKALPEPEADAGRPFVAPRTSTESALAEIWAALMNVERVGAEDDFFALGGHSLLATRLVARVRDRFGVELPLRTLFEAPVLAALAAQIDQRAGAERSAEAPPIVRAGHDGTAPASFAQERLWFVDRLEGGGAVYHIPSIHHLAGAIDPAAMERALNEVVRRHEVLRTSLPAGPEGGPVQRIHPHLPVSLPFHDLGGLADEARDAAFGRLADDNANRPFDLEAGPLYRVSLVRAADDEHVLLLNLHHAAGDGWSIRVLLDELLGAYGAFHRGEAPALPDLPVQYADYAAWQRQWLRGDVLERELAYWRGTLAGAPPLLELPMDRPRPAVQTHRGASAEWMLPRDPSDAVLALGRREGATLFMVLLAAWSLVLSRLSGQDDVVVGTPIAGRTRRETEGLIGPFLNTLALRMEVGGASSFRDLLRRAREASLGAFAHQDLPFERILEEIRPERSLAHTPVFQVMLNLLNYGGGDGAGPGVERTAMGSGAQLASKFDITLYAAETDDGLALHAVYDADLFDAERMREMLAQLAGVLRQAAAEPDRALTAVSLRTQDAASVLPDPSIPIEPEAWRGAVHERFAAVAAASPDAPALRDPRGTWTYAQVDAAASRVAHRLIEAGVQAGEIVAVLAHRSAPLVPALLGAWKAGAAFLVLDPAYPPARLAEYVRIAAPRALVRVPAAGQVPAEVADALAPSSLATIDVEQELDRAHAPAVDVAVLVNPDDLAYVAFTSGTTGQPKAIAGTHRPLPHFFGWYAAEFGLGAADRFSMLSGLAHDPLLRDVFAPLLAGGTLVIPDPEQIGTPGYLAHWMRAEAVTVAHLTPAMGQLLTGVIEDAELFGAAESQPGTQPPPAVLGEVGEWSEPGGGARAGLSEAARFQPGTQPPPAVLGEVGEWSEPGGGARADLSEAARFQPGTQPPPAVLGEVGEWSEPGGGARADLSEAARFQPGTQPPPAVLGEVGEWSEPGGGARAELFGAAESQPGTQPPPAVLGEVGEWSEPGGGARADLSEAARSQPGTQPPPAVLGEVGEWSEPGGGARAELFGAAKSQPGTQPPPAVLGEVGEWSEPGGGARTDLSDAAPALRLACFGGETLRAHDVRRLRAFAPGVRIANFYGATETPQAMAAFDVPDDVAGLPAAIPVGRGIGGVDLLVLAADGSVAGVGEVGEIVIRTPYLSRGYLNDDSLTAARFVINPATGDPRDRAYRTGDLGRYRPDGTVEVAGRADAQVKLRGFRIEPGEVESALRAHPAVRDAAVLARGEGDGQRLVAWLVAGGERPGPAEMRESLRGRLPDYMVPAAFVWLNALPLTPNGKLDRRALPDPQAPAEAGYVAPRTTTEEVLANAWAALLRVERVGATDDFFALGGHSLLATRVAARVRDAFGVELPLRAVFQSPTLAALAADVDARRRAGQQNAAPPLRRVPRGGDAPASFQQERLWFLERLEGGGAVYNLPAAHHLAGALDAEALRRAVEALVHRHETLRTALPEVDGAPVQRILPAEPIDLPLIDLSGLAEAEREAAFARAAEANAGQPFDIERGPLFHAALVRLAGDQHVLLTSLHHAVADGWSSGVLWRDLEALYAAFARGEPSPLPPLPVQYADYAAWQRTWLRGETLDRQLDYWRGRLAGAPPRLELPADRPRPEVQTHAGASEWLQVPRALRDAAAALGRGEGATLFMVLLAAFSTVLGRLAGDDDVVVGTPVAGRTRAELEGLIGPFINTLALRAELGGDPSFRALLRRVRESTLEAYAHQDVPFERVIDVAQTERSRAHTPVFQVMLNLFNFGGDQKRLEGMRVEALGAGAQASSKFDLTLYAGESPDGLGLHCLYNPDLFDAVRMRALLAQVAAVLRQAVDGPDRPLSALSLHTGVDPARAAGLTPRTAAGGPAGVGEVARVWAAGEGAPRPTGQLGRLQPDGSVVLLGDADAWRARRPSSAAVRSPAPEAAFAAPATDAERAMAQVWREVLGADGVGMEDDFFALGGHSLLGVRLLARVRQRFGRVLPLGELFRSPTPRALAAAVAGKDADAGGNLVPIHPGGALPPFFCVHPAGGTVFHYAELARLLAPDQPFYGLQATGVNGEAPPLRSVDGMAERYLAQVRRVQPAGPYFLGGWSAGGIVALRMAERLRATGAEVATVALFDTRTPDFGQTRRVLDPPALYRNFAASLVPADEDALAELESALRASADDERLARLSAWMAARQAGVDAAEVERIRVGVEVFQATAAATREHRVQPYAGRVDLFCAREGTAGEGMQAAALPEKWRALGLAALRVHAVPGTHAGMVLPPHVIALSAALRDALAAARRAGARDADETGG